MIQNSNGGWRIRRQPISRKPLAPDQHVHVYEENDQPLKNWTFGKILWAGILLLIVACAIFFALSNASPVAAAPADSQSIIQVDPLCEAIKYVIRNNYWGIVDGRYVLRDDLFVPPGSEARLIRAGWTKSGNLWTTPKDYFPMNQDPNKDPCDFLNSGGGAGGSVLEFNLIWLSPLGLLLIPVIRRWLRLQKRRQLSPA